ncbi:MAG: YqaA family protein [Planctomycetota bacterium]
MDDELKQPRGGILGALLWPMRQLKRLYHWVVGWANTKYGLPALAVLSFAEASFFPIPPDPLLIALCLGKRKRALLYGFVCTVASVLGGIAGWYIGVALFDTVVSGLQSLGADGSWFGTAASVADWSAEEIAALPSEGGTVFYPDGYFYKVQQRFMDNAFVAYFGAALSPIPYKVFTIAGGVFKVSLGMLIAGSVIGRGLRFMGLSTTIYVLGDKAKHFIDKHFEKLTIALAIVGIAGFVAVKYLI